MSAQQMQPRMMTTSLAADFFTVSTLETHTGFGEAWFPDVVLKELLDNALDAGEAAGIAPRVDVHVDPRAGMMAISVADNGRGIAPDTVHQIVDFSSRTSDKAVYRKPSRGAQGNALKTLLGIVTTLGGHPLVIESHGVRHAISARLRPGGSVAIDHETTPCPRIQGTTIGAIVEGQGLWLDGHAWVKAFALFNPHATFSCTEWQESGDGEEADDGAEHAESRWHEVTTFYRSSVSFPRTWRTFVPTDAASPHWYTPETMRLLVDAYIASDQVASVDTPVRNFVREFRGLSSTRKAATVLQARSDVRRMADLEDRPDLVATLHATMCDLTTPAKPEILGAIGAAHLADRLGTNGTRSWYHKVAGLTTSGQPFVLELVVVESEQPGGVTYGLNFSPTPGQTDPFARFALEGGKVQGQGVAGYLANAHVRVAHPSFDDGGVPAIVAVHLTAPGLSFAERGKATLSALPQEIRDGLGAALWRTTKTLYAEGEARRKNHAKAERQRDARQKARARMEQAQRFTLKEAVFAVLPEAYTFATGDGARPVGARGLMYQIRPRIQPLTDKVLDDNYCTQVLIPEYERQHGPLARLYYEPRGTFYEPHGGVAVPLGTREIAGYTVPPWDFDKILFVEKTGLYPVLADAQLGNRYDMAIIASNGFGSVACRRLLERASRAHGCQVFVLHDADDAGYNIARTLADETRRMPGHHIDVIDLGLKFEDGLALGIVPETYTRTRALPTGLEPLLAPRERAAFGGRSVGRRSWICERIELNALSSPQLIAHIEAGLEKHGATGKVIPPEELLRTTAADIAQRELDDIVHAEISRRLDVAALTVRFLDEDIARGVVDEAVARVSAATVSRTLEHERQQSWGMAIRYLAQPPVRNAQEAIHAAIGAFLSGENA
jgi:DNA topoisomerase VI subunit B